MIKNKIFDYFKSFLQVLPIPIYWIDKEYRLIEANSYALHLWGITSINSVKNKYIFDICQFESPEITISDYKDIVQNKISMSKEVQIKDEVTKENKHFNIVTSPSYDDNGDITGLICVFIDITAEKKFKRLEAESRELAKKYQEHEVTSEELKKIRENIEQLRKAKVLEDLERIAQMLPSPFYWLDTRNVILGGNELALHGIGAESYSEVIGKTPHDLYPVEIADNITNHNEAVIKAGKILSQEESIKDITTGKTRYYPAVKAPLFDYTDK